MRLGLALGYWGRGPAADHLTLAREAERLGYDSVWTAESWGSDAFTPLTWIAARTSRIKLGTAVAQMAARSPTATAMHALTLDHLSGGRMMLGLGLSGPQVVEGWYGRPFPASPLTATREYVDVVRQVLRREGPVTLDGRFHALPYRGADGTGLGKPLKPITHPLRAGLPVLLGAEGPRNVAQTVRIADGWLPLYWSPTRPEVYEASLAGLLRETGGEGRPGPCRQTPDCPATPCTLLHARPRSRGRCPHCRTPHSPECIQYEGPRAARREHAPDAAGPALRADDGSSTTGPSRFLVAPMARVKVCDDVAEGLLPVKAMLGFYIGGMGPMQGRTEHSIGGGGRATGGRNFHADLMARMGYEEEAHRIQRLFLEGRREEAVLAVPDAFADEISLVGPRRRIAERLELWRKGPVTDLLALSPDPHTLRVLAELNT
ncbi:LLM class flavin-dependent oxidoreductase [Streptomyces sp. NPDC052036]|uniref:LLM class flavin-dependent oxidoreductase n=1 Tax=Streptomyces sp. NPDC052036 TaxID=3155171 RepID=UPI0034185914